MLDQIARGIRTGHMGYGLFWDMGNTFGPKGLARGGSLQVPCGTVRELSKLAPRTLALMHGPSFTGDGSAALCALADDYDRRVSDQLFTAR